MAKRASDHATNLSVAEVRFKNGQTIKFAPSDLVLVVGRNSSGKSTFLREIRSSLRNDRPSKRIVSEALFAGYAEESISARFHSYYSVWVDGPLSYVKSAHGGIEFQVPSFKGGPDQLKLGQAADAFITLLNAEGRLRLTDDVKTIDIRGHRPSHPYHAFMLDPVKLAKTSSIIKQAFGLEVSINRIGDPIRGYVAQEFPQNDNLSGDRALPETGELLTSQGDGLRSFTGIISELEAMSHPIVLIDEPEAFLHPPQAKRLGRNISNILATDRQAFIATHSSDFLQGIIAQLSSRIRVLRLERDEEDFKVLDLKQADLIEAQSLPSLANTNLLDSLFYDRTIICEADGDCKMFEYLMPEGEDQSDTFWLSVGGKQQFPKVAKILTTFGVEWRAVLDLDVMLDWKILEELSGLRSLDIGKFRRGVQSALKSMKSVDLAKIRTEALQKLQAPVDDEAAIRDALRAIENRRVSTPLKQYGLNAIPNGQERQTVEDLIEVLAETGILLLRKGELESYVPKVGGHGPAWVNAVLASRHAHSDELGLLAMELSTLG